MLKTIRNALFKHYEGDYVAKSVTIYKGRVNQVGLLLKMHMVETTLSVYEVSETLLFFG